MKRPDPHVRSIRILYMPPVYAITSFFSYRFFRSYTYYSLIEIGALPPFVSGAHPNRLFAQCMRYVVTGSFSGDIGTEDYIRL
jgi:hypothetical protein